MMDGFPCRLLAATLLAIGLSATPATAAKVANVATAASAPGSVRLVAPGEGAVLEPGSSATLEWAPLAGLRQKEWEEWEAFLSLDGGATYPVRITPHLDRDLRRFSWKVPDLPTGNARLLLRVGDERQELAFELPQRFAIARPARVPMPLPALSPGNAIDLSRKVGRRGEPARPGEPGVLAWVEGSRRGGGLREVVAEEPARAVPGVALPAEAPALPAVAAEVPPSGAPAAEPGVRSAPQPEPAQGAARARAPRPRSAADILLLLQRQNE
jgi:hypothetical protein